MFIDDVTDAFIKSYNKNSNNYDIINVCTSKKYSVEDLNNEIIKNLKTKFIKYTCGTPGDQFGIVGNNS